MFHISGVPSVSHLGVQGILVTLLNSRKGLINRQMVMGFLTPEAVTSAGIPGNMLFSDLALELWIRELERVGQGRVPSGLSFQSSLSAHPLKALPAALYEPSTKFL